MPFDDTIKEQIRARIDIVDLVSRHVRLKQSGRNFKGLCPFHKEKTPSFMVNPDRSSFHCFGCGKGGDIFTFVQEVEHVEFKEALHMLAEEAGVQLQNEHAVPEQDASMGPAVGKPELLRIHRIALQFYYRQIKPNPQAITYFKSRGLTPEIIKEFGLGYAPPGWSNLLEHCHNQGIDATAMEACGLALRKSADSSPYDRFRERIMFTLFDIGGRPVGFAGRALEKDAKPKYLNSPETLIYQKSRTLYGLHKSRKAIHEQDRIIIVEGYMDYLSLYQAGICNVAATSGTALTSDHGQIIRRFTRHVSLVFDGDKAGITAAQRAVYSLASHNLDVRVLILPAEEDPDSFIGKYGPDAFLKLLEKCVDGLEFVLERLRGQVGTDTPQGVSQILDQAVPYLQALTDEIVLVHSVRIVARELGVDEKIVLSRLGRRRPRGSQEQNGPKPVLKFDVAAYAGTLEGNFMRILLSSPKLVEQARSFVGPETFTSAMSKNIYSTITRAYDSDPGLEHVLDSIEDPLTKAAISGLLMQDGPIEQAQEDLTHSLVALQKQFLKNQQRECTERLRKVSPEDKTLKAKLLKHYKEITAELNELKNA